MSIITLEPANGPACPRCGCRDSKIVQYPPEPGPDGKAPWWAHGRARCKHCGLVFSFRELPPEPGAGTVEAREAEPAEEAPTERDVAYPVRACPECGSPETRVKSSPRPRPRSPKIRYHICLDCKARFKSIDSRQV